MKINEARIVNFCDRAVLFSVYAAVFYLPISKALIETFIGMAFLFFLIKKIIKREGLRKSWFNFALLLYVLVCLVSVILSTNLRISVKAFFFKLTENVLFLLVIVDTLNNKARIKGMLYVLLAASALVGLDGIYQYFTHREFLRNRPEIFDRRLTAAFVTPNAFGCFLAGVMPFSLVQVFTKTNSRKFRWLAAAIFFLLF